MPHEHKWILSQDWATGNVIVREYWWCVRCGSEVDKIPEEVAK